jgi:hypothetical protein
MSDKKATGDRDNSLLKKKSSRKKKGTTKLEEFDIKKFKEKLFNELSNTDNTK